MHEYLSPFAYLTENSTCYLERMRYFLLLALTLGLAACDPSDVIDVDINPSQAVEDAVDGVQQGVDGLNDAVQNFGGEEENGQNEGGGKSENEEN